jgi:Zn-dependent peptidase ImmA (M78 family)
LYILYIEKVDCPALNRSLGKETYKISPEEIEKAQALFDYGKSLIAYYSPWDKENLPNPEIYQAEKRDYIEQTNMNFTEAAKFILAHELTHLEKHIDQLNKETPDTHYLSFEKEADAHAIEHILKSIPLMGEMSVKIGVITGLLSMLYFSAKYYWPAASQRRIQNHRRTRIHQH